ncbi:MAG: MIP/aquaporin family protein [Pyrinomonadaceae bacterium]
MKLSRKLAAEFVGTAALLAIVVGSGIMAERLAAGNDAIALLCNSLAIAAGLVVLIYGFGVISGAHFNPAVTLTENLGGRIESTTGIYSILVQIVGAVIGVMIANLMFELPAINIATKARTGVGQYIGEFVATFGLIGVIRLGARFWPNLVGTLVACYIGSACWFTSSTSFANPAVTIARTLSNTFTGISPESVPMFIVMQLIGAITAMMFFNWLLLEVENNE